MARTVDLFAQLWLSVTETIDSAGAPAAAGDKTLFDQYKLITRLRSTSTPATAANVVDLSQTLAGADTDFDLTAAPLARDIAATADLTGKKLLAYFFQTDAANATNIIIKPHPTTNPYPLFKNAAGLIELGPGRTVISCIAESSAIDTVAVAAAVKVIRYSGTAGAIIRALLVFGT